MYVESLYPRRVIPLLRLLAYTSLINVLGYCSAVVPVTFGDKNVDVIKADFEPLSDRDRINMEACEYLVTRRKLLGRFSSGHR